MSAMDDFARGRIAAIEAQLAKYGPMLKDAHASWLKDHPAAGVEAGPDPAGAAHETTAAGVPNLGHALAIPDAGLTAEVEAPPAPGNNLTVEVVPQLAPAPSLIP